MIINQDQRQQVKRVLNILLRRKIFYLYLPVLCRCIRIRVLYKGPESIPLLVSYYVSKED